MGFFNLSIALEEVSDAFGAKETAIASAKLLGKGFVNLAHFCRKNRFGFGVQKNEQQSCKQHFFN
ncbi:hypothetical protein, partial [Klebsiella pneumoniae]|uniref:hypothetical protein n=1 Tax=Klebsiella pneumoniae TaxID=573 RepID=UPI003CEA96D1